MKYRPDYLTGFPPADALTPDALANRYESLRQIINELYADPGHPGLTPSQTIIARAVRRASAPVSWSALFHLLYYDRPNDPPISKTVSVFIVQINRIKCGRWRIEGTRTRPVSYFMTNEDKRAFDLELLPLAGD